VSTIIETDYKFLHVGVTVVWALIRSASFSSDQRMHPSRNTCIVHAIGALHGEPISRISIANHDASVAGRPSGFSSVGSYTSLRIKDKLELPLNKGPGPAPDPNPRTKILVRVRGSKSERERDLGILIPKGTTDELVLVPRFS
jgi:hypothetical protein